MRTLDIFFDVDYTILGLDGSLRPWTREVFEQLVEDGHRLHVWSGVGDRSAVLREHGLTHLVEACYQKPLANHEAALAELGVPLTPDFVIDDSPEIPAGLRRCAGRGLRGGHAERLLPPRPRRGAAARLRGGAGVRRHGRLGGPSLLREGQPRPALGRARGAWAAWRWRARRTLVSSLR